MGFSVSCALNIIANILLNIGALFFLSKATAKPIYKQIRLFKKGGCAVLTIAPAASDPGRRLSR